MTKGDRQIVFEMYEGKCAYCGCDLLKGWHVDHLEPVRRSVSKDYCFEKRKLVTTGVSITHPERDCIENMLPACASCNINKHSMTVEQFRNLIAGFIKSLNERSTQYKIAKRYGLVQETGEPVQFFFEKPPFK